MSWIMVGRHLLLNRHIGPLIAAFQTMCLRLFLVSCLCMIVALPLGIANYVLHNAQEREQEQQDGKEQEHRHTIWEALLESMEAILTGDTLDAARNACFGGDGVGGSTPLPMPSCTLHFTQISLGPLMILNMVVAIFTRWLYLFLPYLATYFSFIIAPSLHTHFVCCNAKQCP